MIVNRLILTSLALALPVSSAELTATLHGDQPGPKISRHIYGHFAEHLGGCIYDGLWVGEDSAIPNTRGIRNDVVTALKDLDIPNLRWPGGCYADDYHWQDGIGSRDQRKARVNRFWGKVVETNHFGTHEFLDLCEMLDCEAYIAGNVGSGSPREMQQWLEYLTHPGGTEMSDLRKQNGRNEPWRVAFFGVGNENWGCGGNMSPEKYAEEYKTFRTYLTSYNKGGTKFVACGPGGENLHWMDVVSDQLRGRMDAISAHYYVMSGPWSNKGDAVNFSRDEWFQLMRTTLDADRILAAYDAILDKGDKDNRVGLYVDEWGTWWNPTPGSNPGFLVQQNTLRDAVSAALFFHQFHAWADRVQMANIAQTVNVLQSMIFTDGPRMVRTPTYHAFHLYKPHMDATRLPIEISSPEIGPDKARVPAVHASASKAPDGSVTISLVNIDPENAIPLTIDLRDVKASRIAGRILTADTMNAHNTFDAPDAVTTKAFSGARLSGKRLTLELPAKSIVTLSLR
jgi:alpha-N-arabinofuranosidase